MYFKFLMKKYFTYLYVGIGGEVLL